MTDELSKTEMQRRRVLKTIGAGALTNGLAGCSSLSTGDEAEAVTSEATDGSPSKTTADGTTPGTETDAPSDGKRVAFGDCTGILPEVPDPQRLEADIDQNTTLGDDCGRYVVSGTVDVTGATLTIKSGTELVFEQNAGLKIATDATLVAKGTCKRPVLFTGAQETRGFWRGIYFEDSNKPNEMAYCVVEYAGGGDEFWQADVEANLAVGGNSRIAASNCAFRESGAWGFTFGSEVHVDDFSKNAVTANAAGAGFVRDASAHHIDGSGTYTGNDDDVVHIWGHDGLGDGFDETWSALDARYRVSKLVELGTDAHLTIEFGTTLSFEQEAGLKVSDSSQLTAAGIDPDTEESKPITFTGEQKTRGFWRGLYFETSDRVPSVIENCVVEYGGGGKEYWSGDTHANVVVGDGARARITNTTLRESGGYGFNFAEDVTIDSFVNNTVTRNANGAGYVRDDRAHFLSDTGTYAGNDTDRVYVWQHDDIGTDLDVTWDAIDVPYFVDTGTVSVYGTLTIEPGATLEFGQDSGLKLLDGGILSAVGTGDEPITFTGEQQTRGYWRGIYFDDTNRTENKLHYCIVEYGGGGREFWNAKEYANVAVTNGSRLSIQHSTIRNSAGYGYEVAADSTLTASANSVVDNALGPKINT
ncbi:hypothetical protein [Haladaptatus sp. CMAA 1911]|uniref:hypothetical protein n=1 Tax=unclassified Haladaptatus TaxID=2622732 RepID=UPI003754D076